MILNSNTENHSKKTYLRGQYGLVYPVIYKILLETIEETQEIKVELTIRFTFIASIAYIFYIITIIGFFFLRIEMIKKYDVVLSNVDDLLLYITETFEEVEKIKEYKNE